MTHLMSPTIIAIGHKAKIGKPHDEEKLLWEKVHAGKFYLQ
jgi:hypothetical protein